jgi:hypothetical protein
VKVKFNNSTAVLFHYFGGFVSSQTNFFKRTSFKKMWTESVNSPNLSQSFNASLEKDTASRGSFEEDFQVFCTSFNIIRCPYIRTQTIDNGEKLVIMNTILDLCNWRAALLACATINSKIKEIYLHGCQLTPQHITDLAITLNRSANITAVTLQYVDNDFQDPTTISSWSDSFTQLVNETTCIEYLCLKGNRLSDDILLKLVPIITSNLRLNVLNLSDNTLTLRSILPFLMELKYSYVLRGLSLANNLIDDYQCIKYLFDWNGGVILDGSEDAKIKSLTKGVADKNKGLKDINKKRKKAGLKEFEEFPSLPDFIKSMDGTKMFVNQSLKFFDISGIIANQTEDLLSLLRSQQEQQQGRNWSRIEESGLRILLSLLPNNNSNSNNITSNVEEMFQDYNKVITLY